MPCSKCGKDGHNSKTCPESSSQDNSHVLWMKIDNVNEKQADDLSKAMIDAKRDIAPNARGTFVKGLKQELPNKIADAFPSHKRIKNEKKNI